MADWFYGKEGQQYGPIDEPTLRARVATGEIAQDDLIWTEGMNEWTPLNKVSQFNAQAPAAVSSGSAETYESSDPTSPYAPPAANPVAPPLGGVQIAPPTSGLAIASLVCGIVAILLCACGGFVAGIPAVICGHMAMKQTAPVIGSNQVPMGGRGMAIAGLIMGYIGIVFTVLGIAAQFAGIAMQP